MISSSRIAGTAATRARVAVAVLASVFVLATPVGAQTGRDALAAASDSLSPPVADRPVGGTREGWPPIVRGAVRRWAEPTTPLGAGIRRSLDRREHVRVASRGATMPVRAFGAAVARRQRSLGRKVFGGVIGAVGGFFAGGFLGAAIEGSGCNCDDPGLQGFIIGAPIGAVVGGIVGVKYF